MKKVFVIFLLAIAALSLCCCNVNNQTSSNDNEPSQTLICYVPDGAPALAVANIIADKSVGKTPVETTVTTGENAVAKCVSGEADMAILPTNAAVTVLSKRSEYCLFTVNVQGLLYVVGTQEVTNLSDLTGKTVYSIGLGNTPEFVFKKILDTQNIAYGTLGEGEAANQVTFKYETDGSTIIPLVLQGKAQFAVLGEPAVTNLISKAASQNKTVFRLFDLQQLWQQATNSNSAGYPQASLIVKRDLLSQGKFAELLMQKLSDNSSYIMQNAASLNQLMQSAGSSLDVDYTPEIIERCNLTVVSAISAKQNIENYLQTFQAMQTFLPLNTSLFYEFDN